MGKSAAPILEIGMIGVAIFAQGDCQLRGRRPRHVHQERARAAQAVTDHRLVRRDRWDPISKQRFQGLIFYHVAYFGGCGVGIHRGDVLQGYPSIINAASHAARNRSQVGRHIVMRVRIHTRSGDFDGIFQAVRIGEGLGRQDDAAGTLRNNKAPAINGERAAGSVRRFVHLVGFDLIGAVHRRKTGHNRLDKGKVNGAANSHIGPPGIQQQGSDDH